MSTDTQQTATFNIAFSELDHGATLVAVVEDADPDGGALELDAVAVDDNLRKALAEDKASEQWRQAFDGDPSGIAATLATFSTGFVSLEAADDAGQSLVSALAEDDAPWLSIVPGETSGTVVVTILGRDESDALTQGFAL